MLLSFQHTTCKYAHTNSDLFIKLLCIAVSKQVSLQLNTVFLCFADHQFPRNLNIQGENYTLVSDAAGNPVINDTGNALYARNRGNQSITITIPSCT